MLLPEAFKERMRPLLGDAFEDFIATYNQTAQGGLRVNTLKMAREEFLLHSSLSLSPVPWAKDGFYYAQEDRPGKHIHHEMGLYYMQEPSAMSVAELAAVVPGEIVLDLCAAPGGKSTSLAAALKGEGLLISNEIHPARCKILSQNIERMGIRNAVVTNETPQALSKLYFQAFDCVVVDAPCSGEGMFRKDEEAIRQWSAENVTMCAERQKEILREAVKMVKPGGRLIYSTCTFEPAENEEMIEWLMKEYPEFEPGEPVPAGGMVKGATKGTLRLWPHLLQGEGHFEAILYKKNTISETIGEDKDSHKEDCLKEEICTREKLQRFGRQYGRIAKKNRPDKQRLALWEEFAAAVLKTEDSNSQWLGKETCERMVLFGEQLYLLPCDVCLEGSKVLRAGLHLGTFEKKRFEPSHSLALALRAEEVCNLTEADEEETARYIKGETLNKEGEKGWTLVTNVGYPVGWGKRSNNCVKNHYPKGLRK